jgi:choline dehydrogenase-like flavoprotein
MLISATRLDARSVLRARYCVIGTGIGGSAVAQGLSAAGQDVLMLEAGTTELVPDDQNSVRAEHVGRSFNIPISRCIELGGTSNQWHGICAPLDDIDFERRPWIERSGWPIRKHDLSPFYRQASALLGIDDANAFETQTLAQPLRQLLSDLDFDRTVLQNKVVQFRKPPIRWKDTLQRLASEGKLRIVLDAPALELVPSNDGGRIEQVIVGAGDRTTSIEADVFIVCAGGLETPRLLLNSHRGRSVAIGNSSDMVGRCLMDHPVGHYCKLGFKRPTKAPLYASLPLHAHSGAIAGLMLSPDRQRDWQLPNHYLWIRPSVSAARVDDDLLMSFLAVRGVADLSARQMWAILTNRDVMYRIMVHRFGIRPTYRYGDLFYMTEQLPDPSSRVMLSTARTDKYGYPVARIDWRLSSRDLADFERYTKVLFGEGLRSPQYSVARQDEIEIWERTVASAAHHLGTARMSDTQATGVVDANLRVFEASNLYVCDASVFSTAGSVNPSLTITALALRLAAHLSAQDSLEVRRTQVVAN